MAEAFGKYELVRRLAFGGMAELFLARLSGAEGFEKRLVLKRILPQFCADPAFVKMFIDEAVVAGRLSHPNLVQVHDFGDVAGVYFIAMEHVDGVDLRHLLKAATERRELLSPAAVAAIGEGVARGLAYAHGFADERLGPLGIVHRDVSPHNVMVSRAGDVKVMDFGIAKAAARATRTATGTIKGKVAYMAPEQAAGSPVDCRADEFALGLVLWECLTGERLFSGDSDLEMLQRVMSCQVRPPSSVRPEVPAALEAVVMRMLEREPERRFGDLGEVEQALAAFRFSLGAAGAVRLGSLVPASAPAPGGGGEGRRTRQLEPAAEAGDAWAPDIGSAGTTEPQRADQKPSEARTVATPGAADVEILGDAIPDGSQTVVDAPAGRPRWLLPTLVPVAVALAALAVWQLWARQGGPPVSRIEEVAPAGAARLELVSQPPGAAVRLDGLDVGLRTPAVLPGLEIGKQVTVELAVPGYATHRQDVLLTQPLERLVVGLAPVTGSAVIPAASPPEPDRHGAEARGKASRRGTGTLSLRSTGPWVDVYLRGKKLGTTPLDRVEVPAGSLELRLVNEGAGIAKVVTVNVAPGVEVRQTVQP